MTDLDAVLDTEEIALPRENVVKWLQFQSRVGHGRSFMSERGLDILQFVTLHTHAGQPLFESNPAKQLLLAKLHETKDRFHLDIAGYVVLDDHLHFLYATKSSQAVATIVDSLREGFARDWRRVQRREGKSVSGKAQSIWKPEIQSYPLTLVDEARMHLNFIHYDPVRHGLVERATDYAWSSLPARVHQGHYSDDWAVRAPPAGVAKVVRALYQPS